MAQYLPVVKVPTEREDADKPHFAEAVELMGYDDPFEAWDEIQPSPGDEYYVLCEEFGGPVSKRPPGKEVNVTVLTLIGGRWYPSETMHPGVQDENGLVWVTERVAYGEE